MGCALSNRKKSGQSQTIIFQQTGQNQGQQQLEGANIYLMGLEIEATNKHFSAPVKDSLLQIKRMKQQRKKIYKCIQSKSKHSSQMYKSESLEQSFSKKSEYSSKKQSSENSNQQQSGESNSENQLNNNSTYRNISVHEEQKNNPIIDEQS
ncbi:unnamed protein product [Paramecium primaurelia]|uniref:Uncharacterized protein n=1 Tax=Paramecium primaurelia TaxID=5886 RepID=A0A8S1L0Q3_PARPR|nr:unnamed protein product [Paramecium primaurelia]